MKLFFLVLQDLYRYVSVMAISQITASPLQSLVVANGGLGNGVSREALSAALKEMGELETLIMHPHKPYAFVTYRYGCYVDS